MPMYAYYCEKCHAEQDIFKRIADLDKPEACPVPLCIHNMRRRVVAPAVLGDYPGYSCPVTGKWIEGRRAHVENLKQTGCRVLEQGETAAAERFLQREENELFSSIENTVDETIAKWPARKREALAAEMEAGLTASVTRVAP